MADILAEMLDLAVLKNRGMMVLAAANIVGMFGFFIPIIFSSSRAIALGVSSSNAALLLSIIGKYCCITSLYYWYVTLHYFSLLLVSDTSQLLELPEPELDTVFKGYSKWEITFVDSLSVTLCAYNSL